MDDEKLENLLDGFRAWGYSVFSKPLPGEDVAFYETLRAGLERVDQTVQHLRATSHCRGKSERTMHLLHSALPEPCWGVRAYQVRA